MEEGARRLQRLGVACLILAAVMAPPALSAAQEEAPAGGEPAPASTPPSPPAQTPASDQTDADADASAKPDGDKEEAEKAGAPAAVPSPEPAPALAAAAKKQPKAVAAASALVSMGDNFYSPRTVSIAVGDTVTWRNNGQAQHSATADDGSFDTGVYGPGQSRSHTFRTAGTFSYFCTVHGQAQSGTVRVASVSGGGGGGDDAGSAASGQSEADAVASAGAAGDSNTLPMTGYASGGLALVGLMLLAAGLFLRRFDDQRRPFLSFPLR